MLLLLVLHKLDILQLKLILLFVRVLSFPINHRYTELYSQQLTVSQ